ncbi:four-carbon acid sugar kinase family protein [Sagittula sp. NFXS13]|uniref:four-carbon acid sugar kinase family protein n=1 Tax=Sagittula sp. NFXS13 TaxID=2819095 RepID=UPI0032E0226A
MAPRLAWLGDDFTGSAAVMEVLAFAGLRAVLFSGVPTGAMAARFADADAVGIATTARTETPDQMRASLPDPLAWLDRTEAEILHYKVCSTFDSAPHSGNIGTAIDLCLQQRASDAVPMVVAAPQMRRYQAFGHLFAGTFDGVFRLDRHPVMSRHPVTPMQEADLLRHLAPQTDLPSALIDLESLWSDAGASALQSHLDAGARVLSLDSMDPASEEAVGHLIWENRARLRVVVGSQGVEYALVRHWQRSGGIAPAPSVRGAGAVSQIAAVSGSVSPSTAQQLAWSAANGFAVIGFDTVSVLGDASEREAEIDSCIAAATQAAAQGHSPLVTSAEGPDDPRVAAFRAALATSELSSETANARIGQALGRVLDGVLHATGIRRAVISGGDTSGHGMRALGLEALEALAPTIPGAALCIGHGGSAHDGLQIALKGGQMGSEDFFGWIRDGGGPRQGSA